MNASANPSHHSGALNRRPILSRSTTTVCEIRRSSAAPNQLRPLLGLYLRFVRVAFWLAPRVCRELDMRRPSNAGPKCRRRSPAGQRCFHSDPSGSGSGGPAPQIRALRGTLWVEVITLVAHLYATPGAIGSKGRSRGTPHGALGTRVGRILPLPLAPGPGAVASPRLCLSPCSPPADPAPRGAPPRRSSARSPQSQILLCAGSVALLKSEKQSCKHQVRKLHLGFRPSKARSAC
jgi:hypothetical protein